MCCLACYFVKDVISQYQAKKTYLGQSLKPITKLPTITFCSEGYGELTIGEDLNISYYIPVMGDESFFLKEKMNFVGQEVLQLTQILPFGETCFKINITSSVPLVVSKIWRGFDLMFADGFEPKYLTIYVTSEPNSYGSYYGEWYDGKVLVYTVEPKGFITTLLQPTEYIYLEEYSNCSNKVFIEQWKSHLQKLNFSDHHEECFGGIGIADILNLPLCSNDSELVKWDMYSNYRKFTESGHHQRPCRMLEYSGVLLKDDKDYYADSGTLSFNYEFSNPELTIQYKEHLVFDTITMIGSVGGTLGMCIGFSFSGVTTTILDFIKARIFNNF